MSERMRWITEEYRGMSVRAIAFEIAEKGRMEPPPGQKWGYMIAIRYTADRDDDMIYGPAGDRSDYFWRRRSRPRSITASGRSTSFKIWTNTLIPSSSQRS
ncbi:hypothetical protein PO002_35750 [Cupriavidus necator]|uniref:hypothetical protein n=1 Tax=Cupriavidus necator TaxID=106590 RepID=UPI0039C44070